MIAVNTVVHTDPCCSDTDMPARKISVVGGAEVDVAAYRSALSVIGKITAGSGVLKKKFSIALLRNPPPVAGGGAGSRANNGAGIVVTGRYGSAWPFQAAYLIFLARDEGDVLAPHVALTEEQAYKSQDFTEMLHDVLKENDR